MPEKINPKQSTIDIQSWWSDVDIMELKNWVDHQISIGKNTVSVNVSWGYYNDIDGIEMSAKKVTKK